MPFTTVNEATKMDNFLTNNICTPMLVASAGSPLVLVNSDFFVIDSCNLDSLLNFSFQILHLVKKPQHHMLQKSKN